MKIIEIPHCIRDYVGRRNDMAQQDNTFESLLSPSVQSRHSDEYYWQQQSKLQQSAITFKSRKAQDKLPDPTSSENLIHEHALSPKTLPSIDEPAVSHIVIRMEKSSPAAPILSNVSIKPLIKYIEKPMVQPSSYGLKENELNQSAAIDKANPRMQLNKPILAPESIVKPYQLFLTNNQVELSLNTAHLSKQQICDLHILIKDWLAKKGYSLKQLIINGIQQ